MPASAGATRAASSPLSPSTSVRTDNASAPRPLVLAAASPAVDELAAQVLAVRLLAAECAMGGDGGVLLLHILKRAAPLPPLKRTLAGGLLLQLVVGTLHFIRAMLQTKA
jgi:hypothetical protein